MTTEFMIDDATKAKVDEILSHHGTKGMKWGVRRSPRASGGIENNRVTPKPKFLGKHDNGLHKGDKNHPSDSNQNLEKPKPKKASDMTTEELQKAIARLDMEKRYSQLTAQPEIRTNAQKAKKVSEEILAKVAKDSATRVLTDVAVSLGKKAAAAALTKSGQKDVADILMKTKDKKEKP